MKKRAKIARKEKPAEVRYTVVQSRDARIPKYLHAEASDGFDLRHALTLAAAVPGQHYDYCVVPVSVWEAARALGEPVSVEAALEAELQSALPEGDDNA